MRGEDKGAEVLGKVYEQYRLGDPITDEQLRIAIPEAIKLEDLLFAMGDRFNLAARAGEGAVASTRMMEES